MFVQSERFVERHGGRRDDISIYGQESNPTTWRLAAMNLAIRGFAADLGQEPADTFARDQHPDRKFDTILANPPFNVSDWGGERYDNDPRWVYGRPPVGNANTTWLQHILWKLRPGGEAGVVLANGSMSSNTSGEGKIREAMVRGDVVEVMVALPGQLFLSTSIPVCLWFLTNDKTRRGQYRRGETLFIDARQLGTMATRVNRILTDDDIVKIASTVHAWREDGEVAETYGNIPGFCYSATVAEIEKNGFVLTPGRYVGAARRQEDDEPFAPRMERRDPASSTADRSGPAGCRHCRQPGEAGVWGEQVREPCGQEEPPCPWLSCPQVRVGFHHDVANPSSRRADHSVASAGDAHPLRGAAGGFWRVVTGHLPIPEKRNQGQ